VGAFGEKLRQQREQRGIELDAISNTTKISTRMLRALEDERFDQLPGGVFNKGFVRAYARQVGLDEEEMVADYLAALNAGPPAPQSLTQEVRPPAAKPSAVAAPAPGHLDRPSLEVVTNNLFANNNDLAFTQANAADLRQEDRRKQSRRNENRRNEDRLRWNKFQKYPAGDLPQPADDSSAPVPWGKLALTLVFVTLVLAFWSFRRQAQPALTSQPVPFSSQSSAPAPASAPASATIPPSSASSLTPAAASPAETPSPEKSSPKIPAATATPHTEPPSQASPTPAASAAASKPAPEPDPNPPPHKSTATSTAAKPPTTFTLLIRAEKSTWISLIADGKPVAQETLIAPAHTSVRATREIVVKTANAAGISFQLNGREIPAQGNEGEIKTFIFDATGLRTQ
jgi:cytoskeleton protein RodZ